MPRSALKFVIGVLVYTAGYCVVFALLGSFEGAQTVIIGLITGAIVLAVVTAYERAKARRAAAAADQNSDQDATL